MDENTKKITFAPFKVFAIIGLPLVVLCDVFCALTLLGRLNKYPFKECIAPIVFLAFFMYCTLFFISMLRLSVTIDETGIKLEDRLTKQSFCLPWQQVKVGYCFHVRTTYLLFNTKPLTTKEVRSIYWRTELINLGLTPALSIDGACCFPINSRLEKIKPLLRCDLQEIEYLYWE